MNGRTQSRGSSQLDGQPQSAYGFVGSVRPVVGDRLEDEALDHHRGPSTGVGCLVQPFQQVEGLRQMVVVVGVGMLGQQEAGQRDVLELAQIRDLVAGSHPR